MASWEVFAQVNERYGLGVDQPAQYFDLFRGNVFESIRGLCRDEAQANEVTAAFLELLRKEYTHRSSRGWPTWCGGWRATAPSW